MKLFPLFFLVLVPLGLSAQSRIGTGAVAELYAQYCLSCHGPALEGGLGSSLVDELWVYGESDADIARVIREGVPEDGMVPYEGVLSPEQIRSLVIYIREMGQLAAQDKSPAQVDPETDILTSQHHAFRLKKVVGLEEDTFWSVSFLPDGAMLLSQFGGKLFVARDGELGEPILGIPEVHRHGQGGLLEVQAHPDYKDNGWIYMAYAERSPVPVDGRSAYMTAIVRGRIRDGVWIDQEDIFRVPAEFHRTAGVHFGTRFVFKDGMLYFSIGDRGNPDDAQDLTRPNGKVHRIHDDGRIPDDNPFIGQAGAYPSIWSYGHRNPQGLDLNPTTGGIWSTEHGPRGGDELNLIKRGANYGWPVITHGINYNGKPITDRTEAPGMEQPVHQWTPSIAVCGIDFYEGDKFPGWQGDLFVGGLSSQHLERFKLEGTEIVEHEVLFKGLGRIRDVSTGPDGCLYVILNKDRTSGPGSIYCLVPESSPAPAENKGSD
ncbi:MAG TPA: PQQ-dependent sugar dehydrogenase [Oceanipulchritudo sp.]|nr:PQQ-dependent sugar dehydrogenase [Oceanipulchritudo sp.]